MNILKHIKDRIQGKAPAGAKRSSKWRGVRKGFLNKNKECSVCGSTKKLEVHHKLPFHAFPELELDENNLIVLCENKKYGINCHLLIGHLGNYKKINFAIDSDAITWKHKIRGE